MFSLLFLYVNVLVDGLPTGYFYRAKDESTAQLVKFAQITQGPEALLIGNFDLLRFVDNNFYGLNNTIALWDQWYGNPNGNIFQISNILAPVFWGLTFDQSAVIGDSATFSSKADGLPPFAYQWYFNGQLLAGATNENLIISHVNNGEAGTYTLVATNTYGCATSPPSLLGVQLQPNCYAISNWDNGNLAIYFASHPSTANRLWATTNLALGQWQVVSTNIMDTNGLSQFIDTNTPGAFQKFYRLSYP